MPQSTNSSTRKSCPTGALPAAASAPSPSRSQAARSSPPPRIRPPTSIARPARTWPGPACPTHTNRRQSAHDPRSQPAARRTASLPRDRSRLPMAARNACTDATRAGRTFLSPAGLHRDYPAHSSIAGPMPRATRLLAAMATGIRRNAMKIRSILALTDLSVDADRAVRRAARLAADHGAELRLLHLSTGTLAPNANPLPRLQRRARRLARQHGFAVDVVAARGVGRRRGPASRARRPDRPARSTALVAVAVSRAQAHRTARGPHQAAGARGWAVVCVAVREGHRWGRLALRVGGPARASVPVQGRCTDRGAARARDAARAGPALPDVGAARSPRALREARRHALRAAAARGAGERTRRPRGAGIGFGAVASGSWRGNPKCKRA